MAKIFISHSSADKDIVCLFKDIILKSGIGLTDADIFFTSSPETGVPIGGNIPQYIKDNLLDCDFAFLMISENYKNSEVCLNEMGAAMVLGKRLFPVILHNYEFDKVGWLIDRNLCVRINEEERLDEIRDIFNDNGFPSRTNVWNRNRNDFLSKLSVIMRNEEKATIKGYIDYQIDIEGALSEYNNEYNNIVSFLSDNIKRINSTINIIGTSKSLEEQKNILGKIAEGFNTMADYLENRNQKVRDSVLKSLLSVLDIFKNIPLNNEDKEKWIQSVAYFKSVVEENRKELYKVREQVQMWGDYEQKQIESKKRLVTCLDFLLETFNIAIRKSHEVIY